jgi:hypothetical protein
MAQPQRTAGSRCRRRRPSSPTSPTASTAHEAWYVGTTTYAPHPHPDAGRAEQIANNLNPQSSGTHRNTPPRQSPTCICTHTRNEPGACVAHKSSPIRLTCSTPSPAQRSACTTFTVVLAGARMELSEYVSEPAHRSTGVDTRDGIRASMWATAGRWQRRAGAKVGPWVGGGHTITTPTYPGRL